MSQEIKDFQCATAERILHIYKNLGHRRVLLADEVGLGKTYVAKLYTYLQPIITQYFIDNKSEIWLLFLIAHSKR